MELTLRNNIKTIYWLFFFQSFMIIIAVFVPILQQYGLSMSQVMLTQAMFAAVVAVCEVPSGYLADLWGRRNTIVIGQSLIALAFVWLIPSDGFVDFLIYEALMGLGISLASGADLALLYDTQTALDEHSGRPGTAHGKHISRIVAIEGYGGAASGIAAGILTILGFDWVIWAQCLCGFLALYCALNLVEAPRLISLESHTQNVRKVFNTMVYRPVVLWTSLAIIAMGLLGLFSFWMYQKYWEFNGIPVTWYGYIWAGHCAVRGIIGHWAHDIERALGWQKVFLLSAALPLVALFGMGTFAGWVGMFFTLGLILSRGLSTVVFYDALNKRVESDFRATINSLVSLGTRSLFILLGPLLGFIVDTQGVSNALLILGSVMTPVVIAVLFFLSSHIRYENRVFNNRDAPKVKAHET